MLDILEYSLHVCISTDVVHRPNIIMYLVKRYNLLHEKYEHQTCVYVYVSRFKAFKASTSNLSVEYGRPFVPYGIKWTENISSGGCHLVIWWPVLKYLVSAT